MPGEVTAPRAEEHLGLVHLCANRFRNRGIEYDELYSAGWVRSSACSGTAALST